MMHSKCDARNLDSTAQTPRITPEASEKPWLCWHNSSCSEHLLQHWPYPGDSESPGHNPWLALAIFSTTCSAHSTWIYTWGSCDRCKYHTSAQTSNASISSEHAQLRLTPDHEWDNLSRAGATTMKHKL
jgi:hypothetical protein